MSNVSHPSTEIDVVRMLGDVVGVCAVIFQQTEDVLRALQVHCPFKRKIVHGLAEKYKTWHPAHTYKYMKAIKDTRTSKYSHQSFWFCPQTPESCWKCTHWFCKLSLCTWMVTIRRRAQIENKHISLQHVCFYINSRVCPTPYHHKPCSLLGTSRGMFWAHCAFCRGPKVQRQTWKQG